MTEQLCRPSRVSAFPPSLVISLGDSDRRARFDRECGRFLPGPWSFFEATDTRHLGNPHIGCALSHRRAVEEANRRNWEEVLVFEDDACFAPRCGHAIEALGQLPADAELVYLGGFRTQGYHAEPVDGRPGLSRVRGGLMTTHAVLYRRRVFQRVLDYVPPDVGGIVERWGRGDPRSYAPAIDQEYARWQMDPARRIYALDPRPILGNHCEHEAWGPPGTVRVQVDAAPLPVVMLASKASQFLTPLVSKNGSTSLKQVLVDQVPGLRERAEAIGVDNAVGFRPNGDWLIDPVDAAHRRYQAWLRFLVYRDPLERLRSVYRWRAGGAPRQRWACMIAEGMLDGEQLEQNFEALVTAELSQRATPLIDEHLRPQWRTFEDVPVDLIVPLRHLGGFMRRTFGIELPTSNASVASVPAAAESTLRRLVERHYQRDREILSSGIPVYEPR